MLGRRTKHQDKETPSAPEGNRSPQQEVDRVRVICTGPFSLPGIPHYMKERQ